MNSEVIALKKKTIVSKVVAKIKSEDPFDYGRFFDLVNEEILDERITAGLCPFEITDQVIDVITERNRILDLDQVEA